MPPSGQRGSARRRHILEQLARSGKVSVAQLSQTLGATAVTIRSDLRELEREGYLERIPGGAIIAMPRTGPQQLAARHLPEKRAIAAAAARLIQDGDVLFLNSGSTTHQLALALRERRGLNVVTNSLSAATSLGGVATDRVLLLGGELDAQYLYTCGGDALEQLQRYQADYAVLSLGGVHADAGLTTYHPDEAALDRMMVARARHTLILADHSKLGRTSFSLICPLQQNLTVVTDSACDPDAVAAIRAAGVRVITARPDPIP